MSQFCFYADLMKYSWHQRDSTARSSRVNQVGSVRSGGVREGRSARSGLVRVNQVGGQVASIRSGQVIIIHPYKNLNDFFYLKRDSVAGFYSEADDL